MTDDLFSRYPSVRGNARAMAMLCAEAGTIVTTCEAQPTIAATARAIVDRNGFSDRVRVISKRSDLLCIPEDMDAPAELVVHEIFGRRVFDEGVTAALRDARRRLLVAGAPALPARAEIRCANALSATSFGTSVHSATQWFDSFQVPNKIKKLKHNDGSWNFTAVSVRATKMPSQGVPDWPVNGCFPTPIP